MYQFSKDLREAYEGLQIALAIYQVIDRKVVTVLVSEGLCRERKDTRDHLMKALDNGMFERVVPEDAGKLALLGEAFTKHQGEYDCVFRASDEEGNIRSIHAVGYWQKMQDGTDLAFCFYLDLTKSGELIEKSITSYLGLQQDYFYIDPLTKLPNLNYYQKFGEEKVRTYRLQGEQPVLVYFDLSALQNYNNLYGYQAGNELIQKTAWILRENYQGALIVRGSDDHFLVVTKKYACRQVIERVHDQVNQGSIGNTSGIKASVCELQVSDTVFSAMDHALRAFKTINADVNSYIAFYTPELDRVYFQQQYMVDSFKQNPDKDQIHIHYQRIVDNGKETVAFGEALARWMSPDNRAISPGKFIPVLKEYHLLYQLDLHMVEQICRDYHERKKNGEPLVPISVNLSAQDFDHKDMYREILHIVDSYGVPAEKVIIEITEEDVARSSENFQTQLNRFVDSGFHIWVDDFGKGYSNLNVFTKYPFDLIKIDQSLIRELDQEDGRNRIILQSVIDLAKRLGFRTLCEGVETREQYEFVRDAGCDFTQGFYFYKPAPLDEIISGSAAR